MLPAVGPIAQLIPFNKDRRKESIFEEFQVKSERFYLRSFQSMDCQLF